MFAVVHSSGSWYLEIVEIDVGLLVLVHEIVLSAFLGNKQTYLSLTLKRPSTLYLMNF
jgi:hypothetical protein